MYLQLLQEMKNWTSHLAFQTSESSVQLILVFPSVLHLCAALTTQTRRVPDPGGHPCEVTRRAEACATVSDHFRPPNCIGLHAAHHFCSWACRNARGLSHSNSTRRRSCWPYIRHLAPRGGGLQDHLCRFTPPLILRTLDAFPSDQG